MIEQFDAFLIYSGLMLLSLLSLAQAQKLLNEGRKAYAVAAFVLTIAFFISGYVVAYYSTKP